MLPIRQKPSFWDSGKHAKPCELAVVDTVLVKRHRTNKLSMSFDPRPLTISSPKGIMLTTSCGPYKITRNMSHFISFGKITITADVNDDNWFRPAQYGWHCSTVEHRNWPHTHGTTMLYSEPPVVSQGHSLKVHKATYPAGSFQRLLGVVNTTLKTLLEKETQW